MEKNVKLTINDIYNRRFEKDVKGYNPDEVDAFLDEIIKDYDAYEKALASLEDEVDKLNKELSSKTNDVSTLAKRAMDAESKAKELEIQNASLNNKFAGIKPGETITAENLEYIQKIHDYETFLYQQGYDVTKIRKNNK
ncbi:MAG: DivIVA domain-containing protein [Bacilli bacterium]|nr:DivIVA domain-containing protein [Bacilli bacterium]MBR4812025.1 DivIVA domain-containing protein [Bacilli bacterium]MBR5750704.1 DivIVA domain-containing protein [Bacilli bacterium]MBR6226000.1 DivIVA domain-containing protein [Bacilli bacterium]MBR6865962.1 DivIVA domain-containing protein [Bacilli bacterium]